MRFLLRPYFWIRVILFTLLNLTFCFLLGMLLDAKGASNYFENLTRKEILNYFYLSLAFAVAFCLWLYKDPESKKSGSRRR